MATQILPHSPVSSPSQLRAAVYARVSTNYGQDPTVQTRELEEYCQRRGWKVARQYVDVGISGAKEKRPQLDRLIADAHRRKFDAVIVWKFDRFARSVSHLLRALETFKALGIEFVSLSEQVDTSTPTGKMVFTVLGAVAELERSLIAERVKAGMRNARAKGKSIGRPPLTYLSLEARKAIAKAYRQRKGSLRHLAAQYGTSVGTVKRCVEVFQRVSTDPLHNCLILRDQFHSIQAVPKDVLWYTPALTCPHVRTRIAPSNRAQPHDWQDNFALPRHRQARCRRFRDRPTRAGFIQVGLNKS